MFNENNNACAGGVCGEKGNCSGGNCPCGMSKCKGGCLGGHKVIRFAVGFFLLWLVFAFGIQIGEMKGELSKGHSNRGMMQSYGNNARGYGMMGTWSGQASQQAPNITITAPTVKP